MPAQEVYPPGYTHDDRGDAHPPRRPTNPLAASAPTSFAIGGSEAPLSTLRTEVTTRSGPRVLAQTRIDLRGTIDSDHGEPEAKPRQLGHHEAMVRAALEQQLELLRILLGRR